MGKVTWAPGTLLAANFTDPDSQIMETKDGFIQNDSAQAAVGGGNQIILAHGLTNNGSDQGQLAPLLPTLRANISRAVSKLEAPGPAPAGHQLLPRQY